MNYLDALVAFEETSYDHDEEVIPNPVEPRSGAIHCVSRDPIDRVRADSAEATGAMMNIKN